MNLKLCKKNKLTNTIITMITDTHPNINISKTNVLENAVDVKFNLLRK